MTKTLDGQEASVLSSSQMIMRLSVPRMLWMERFFMARVALQIAVIKILSPLTDQTNDLELCFLFYR
jgi:hypothetical protein